LATLTIQGSMNRRQCRGTQTGKTVSDQLRLLKADKVCGWVFLRVEPPTDAWIGRPLWSLFNAAQFVSHRFQSPPKRKNDV